MKKTALNSFGKFKSSEINTIAKKEIKGGDPVYIYVYDENGELIEIIIEDDTDF